MPFRDACAAWLSAPEGRLCAWQQARALALREASTDIHGAPWLPWIAERVTKVGGNPTRAALSQLFALVDADPGWYPGKCAGTKRGRKPLLTVKFYGICKVLHQMIN